MKVLNFGSLNLDYVYQVPHFVTPGETLASSSLDRFAGGKGANQSIALARAGVEVYHAGKVGSDGAWLKQQLEKSGVDTRFIKKSSSSSGHAIIQLDPLGQNAILLHPGANHEITPEEIEQTLSCFKSGDYLLLQHEINQVEQLIRMGHEKGLRVCFNPAPMDACVLDYPLELVDLLIVNETESASLGNRVDRLQNTEIIETQGSAGVRYHFRGKDYFVAAREVDVVDTTAAGDTFIGYYLASCIQGFDVESSLSVATAASALCVSRKGAGEAIPTKDEVHRFLGEKRPQFPPEP